MKIKSFVFVGIIGGVLMFSGCGERLKEIKETKDNVVTSINEGKQLINQGKELVEQGKELKEQKEGVVGGIRNILNGGASLKCEDNEGNVTYTNGKNFRSIHEENGVKKVVLMKDDVMYSWNLDTKDNGSKMAKNCFSELQKELKLPEEKQEVKVFDDFSVETIEEESESGKINCKPSTEGNFEVPTDITFIDQCEIMKEQMKVMQKQIKEMQKKQNQSNQK